MTGTAPPFTDIACARRSPRRFLTTPLSPSDIRGVLEDAQTAPSNSNQVVPILRERGLFHDDHEGPTPRENFGAHEQYGLDPRLTKSPAQDHRRVMPEAGARGGR
ncbi:hypothetical protein [Streptomyces sp. NPDC058307]|uniref:hypothetical protein n=1 Tax=Streptomyces sp. NPDC058307 TaxID=3346439 RepID=UPI0036E124A4